MVPVVGRPESSRRSTAPVGLQPSEGGLDHLFQDPSSEEFLAGGPCVVPLVFVDAAENAVGLAAQSALLDQAQEYPFGLVPALQPVERQSELLANQRGLGQWPRHSPGEGDHLGVALDGTVREEQVDQDFRLQVQHVPENAFGRPYGCSPSLRGAVEPLFHVAE